MKKLFLSCIQLLMSALLITGSASAQRTISASVTTGQPVESETSATKNINETAKAGADIKDIHVRAVKNFNRQYKDVRDVKWSNADKTIMATFEKDGVQNRVIYYKNGRWLHTILSYEPSRLPEPVREIIRSNFRNYDITWVTEIQERDKVFHFVNIENAKSFKQIAVCDDRFRIYKDLKKIR